MQLEHRAKMAQTETHEYIWTWIWTRRPWCPRCQGDLVTDGGATMTRLQDKLQRLNVSRSNIFL